MKAQPGVWGIDLGQCALKALRLQEIDGQLVATAFDYVEHPKILNQPDADPDQLTREALETFLKRNTIGDVNVEVHVIQMAPLALCNFAAFDLLGQGSEKNEGEEGPKKGPCIVVLDIGTDSSNLVITDGGRIIWQRPIPLGGNHFTRALTKELKLTFAKAEHLKRNATKSGATELKKILGALKPVLNDFVGEVQRSLGYFTNTHRDAQIEYMIGLGNAFRLPGMQRFLAEKLQLEVKKLDKMARLE